MADDRGSAIEVGAYEITLDDVACAVKQADEAEDDIFGIRGLYSIGRMR